MDLVSLQCDSCTGDGRGSQSCPQPYLQQLQLGFSANYAGGKPCPPGHPQQSWLINATSQAGVPALPTTALAVVIAQHHWSQTESHPYPPMYPQQLWPSHNRRAHAAYAGDVCGVPGSDDQGYCATGLHRIPSTWGQRGQQKDVDSKEKNSHV